MGWWSGNGYPTDTEDHLYFILQLYVCGNVFTEAYWEARSNPGWEGLLGTMNVYYYEFKEEKRDVKMKYIYANLFFISETFIPP